MPNLPTRSDLHLKRKVFHAAFGCLFAYLRATHPSPQFVVVLAAIVLLFCVGEFCRLQFPAFNTFQRAIFGSVMREHEQTQVSGIVFYLSGVLFSSFFFAPSITVLAALVLGFADPAASAFGITFGKRKFSGNKTLAGLIGFASVSFVVLLSCHILLFKSGPFFSPSIIGGCLGVSLLAGIAELFSGRDNWAGVDDNFVIPCVVSFALLAAREWTAIDLGRF